MKLPLICNKHELRDADWRFVATAESYGSVSLNGYDDLEEIARKVNAYDTLRGALAEAVEIIGPFAPGSFSEATSLDRAIARLKSVLKENS